MDILLTELENLLAQQTLMYEERDEARDEKEDEKKDQLRIEQNKYKADLIAEDIRIKSEAARLRTIMIDQKKNKDANAEQKAIAVKNAQVNLVERLYDASIIHFQNEMLANLVMTQSGIPEPVHIMDFIEKIKKHQCYQYMILKLEGDMDEVFMYCLDVMLSVCHFIQTLTTLTIVHDILKKTQFEFDESDIEKENNRFKSLRKLILRRHITAAYPAYSRDIEQDVKSMILQFALEGRIPIDQARTILLDLLELELDVDADVYVFNYKDKDYLIDDKMYVHDSISGEIIDRICNLV